MSRSSVHGSNSTGKNVQLESRRSFVGRRWDDGIRCAEDRENGVIRQGPFVLDNFQKKVYVHGNYKELPPKLFDLLNLFVLNVGNVLSQPELAATLWPNSKRADPEDVKRYIYLLRHAIEPDPAKPRWLRNVRGFGYRLVVGEEQGQATVTASTGETPNAVAGRSA
ncbi:MAG: winged helix-turn-helix domain-containing protein [Gammaproteobacteria bacterium]|nr:winged helix-turn-helix domain-containing protein [Gammaproteobacteria bacterium]MDH3464610.1 winged helix-turn-helix domain-containing protein [Gammaproteobacteria bacterium]